LFKRILFFSGILFLGMVIGKFFFSDTLVANQDYNFKHKDESPFLQIKNGQTYGSASDAPSYEDEPDLIRAIGIDGTIGYVKKEELNGPMPKTPEEAVKLNDAIPREIPLYDVDGETIIGKFIIGG
jgi:hypothetical protein